MTKLKFCALIAAAAMAISGGVAQAQNNTCATARTIGSLPYFDNTIDTSSGFTDTMTNTESAGFMGGGNSPDAWWTFTPSVDAPDTFIQVVGFDTAFAVYTGGCGGLTEVLAVDQTFGGEQSQFSFLAGTTYHIMCEGFGPTDVGLITLKVGTVPHNECDMAMALDNSSFPLTETGWANSVQTIAIYDPMMFATGGDLFYDVTFTANGGYTFTVTPSATNDPIFGVLAFQDCDNDAGQFMLFDTGLDGAAETSSEFVGFTGDKYTFILQAFNQTDTDPFVLSLVFVAGASVDEWEAY